MAKAAKISDEHGTSATSNDVRRIIGDLDEAKLLAIMALRPTIRDIEEASLWLAGDTDIFGAGQPLKRVAGDIVAILSVDEQEEPPRAP